MLSFQITQSGNSAAIQIHIDEQGLATLVKRIEDARRFGHVHLRTTSGGGGELDHETQLRDKAVREVIIDWCGEAP